MKTGVAKIDVILEKKKKITIISMIIVMLIGIGFGVWGLLINQQTKGEPERLQQLIFSGSKKTGLPAYVEITDAFLFAERGTSEQLYFVMDSNNFLYIVRLDQITYTRLNLAVDPVTVTGVTKKITDEIKKVALDSLDASLGITNKNFEDYIGYIYLDTLAASSSYSGLQTGLAMIFAVIFVILLIQFVVNLLKTKKILQKYSQSEWDDLAMQLDRPSTVEGAKKGKFFLTDDYIVNLTGALDVVRYGDIVWLYRHDRRQNGALVASYAKFHTADKKVHMLQARDPFEIMELIVSKNQSILVGFTSQNREIAKGMYQA